MPTFLGLDPVHWMIIAGGVYLLGWIVKLLFVDRRKRW